MRESEESRGGEMTLREKRLRTDLEYCENQLAQARSQNAVWQWEWEVEKATNRLKRQGYL